MAEKVAAGEIQPEQISAESMAPHLSMADLPPPDLLIRTGGDPKNKQLFVVATGLQ